jgi:hypothetical protein
LPAGCHRVPYIELMVISEDGQAATMARHVHDRELIKSIPAISMAERLSATSGVSDTAHDLL